MRIRSRATVVAIIILTLSMGLVAPQMGLSMAQAQPTELYPVTISFRGVERVFFATHTIDLEDGNWIELSGGMAVKLPSLEFVYDEPDGEYTYNELTVKVDSDFIQDLTYPLSTHQVYKTGQSISSTFWGSPDFGGKTVSFMLLRLSHLSEIREALDEGLLGTIATFLESLVWIHPVTLNSEGDTTHSFTAPAPGDYVLAVAKIDLLDLKFYAYSATAIEVVDDTLDISNPSSIEKGDNVNINSKLTSEPTGPYTHVAAMIKESAYSGEIKFTTDGTFPITQLYVNGELILSEGELDQSDITIDLIQEKFMNTFDTDELAFNYTTATHTGSISLSTSSLAKGDYILLVGVWKDFETRIVGLKQTTIRVTLPPKPPTPIKPNQNPKANAGPNQKAWVGETVYFDGSKSKDTDGYILSWIWSFGDEATASGEEVKHAYSEPGIYEATLTVTDDRYSEDSDNCKIKISDPPAPVANKFSERVQGEKKGHIVDALAETNTIVTLDTTDNVTVTVLRYENNPHPDDPIPASALPTYVDVEISDPDSVVWPIYVEMFYTDLEIEGIEESTLVIYYWMDGEWRRCSNTGVDTERNVVWAYMTAEEAAGSPILIVGMPAIVPPLPPFLSDLTVTPPEIELGDNVTISLDIMNPNDQAITYGFSMEIGELTLLVDVELEAYESKTISRTIFPTAVGDFNVTVIGMTGNFKVNAPPLPAEFVLSNLTIEPEEIELEEDIDIWTFTITVDVTNVGEQEGTHTVDLNVDGDVIQAGTVTLRGGEETSIIFDVTRGVGSYTVEVDELTGSFTVNPPPTPPPEPEFEVSDLNITPEEIELGTEVTVSFVITNADSRPYVFVPFVQIGTTMIMEDVELDGHESRTVSYTITPEIVGDYDVTIDGLEGSFTVFTTPEPPFWMQPGYASGILILIISAGAIIYLIWKRNLLPTIFPAQRNLGSKVPTWRSR